MFQKLGLLIVACVIPYETSVITQDHKNKRLKLKR